MATAAIRIRKREAMWRRVLARHAGSGMSIRAYCAKHRVKEPAFYWWRAELARRDAATKHASKPKDAFVPVVVKGPEVAVTEGLSIELRDGRVLRLPVMPAAQVAELVRLIEGDVPAGAT
jgi:hypothetical protein